MNKCSKCGAEFDGNFCPECGAPSQSPKVCPKCGATLKEDIKFCNNCGYSFFDQALKQMPYQTDLTASAGRAAPIQARSDWKQNKILRTILLYAPFAIFAFWAVLLLAFMAAPVMKGDGVILPTVSVYGFFNSELMSADKDLAAIMPAAAALLSFSLISVLYAGVLAFLQFKSKPLPRWLAHYASALLYVAVLICTSVIAVKFNVYAEGVSEAKGSFVAVTITFTVIFLLLHVVTLVMCKLLNISTITPEEREQAQKRFDEWMEHCKQSRAAAAKKRRDYREAVARKRAEHREAVARKRAERIEAVAKIRTYKHERRSVVKQRINTGSFIRRRGCGAMCIIAIIFILIGSVITIPSYMENILYYSDFDKFFRTDFRTKDYTVEEFENLQDIWYDNTSYSSIYGQTVSYYEKSLTLHAKYEEEIETYEGDSKPDFKTWLSSRNDFIYLYSNGKEVSDKYIGSLTELYNLGVDEYLQQRYPDGFADFVKEATGVKCSTLEEFQSHYKELDFYKEVYENWHADPTLAIIYLIVVAVLIAVAFALGLCACIYVFRRNWRKSVVVGWIFVVSCCALFVTSIFIFLLGMEAGSTIESEIRWIIVFVAQCGVLPLATLFSFNNVFILADDTIKARKRFGCEYDEQKLAEGDVVALKLTSRKRSDGNGTKTTEANGE